MPPRDRPNGWTADTFGHLFYCLLPKSDGANDRALKRTGICPLTSTASCEAHNRSTTASKIRSPFQYRAKSSVTLRIILIGRVRHPTSEKQIIHAMDCLAIERRHVVLTLYGRGVRAAVGQIALGHKQLQPTIVECADSLLGATSAGRPSER
jgi:hypothetical protein